MDLYDLLIRTINDENKDVTDFYFAAGCKPAVRERRQIVYLADQEITNDEVEEFFKKLGLPLEKCDEGVSIAGRRLRCNISKTWRGWDFTARLLPSCVMTLDQLGLPDFLYSHMEKKQGLILICGPTGSGKSTTMAALIEHINQNFYRKIITIEDPIEYVFTPQKSLILQREIQSGESFYPYLREALRQTPDIIVIGEMRDADTVKTAVTAAETGHLVIGTLHTSSVKQSITRMIDTQPEAVRNELRQVLSVILDVVLVQKLILCRDGKLRPAFEILVNNPASENYIRQNKIHQIPNAILQGKRDGSILLNDSLRQLIQSGYITKEEGRKFSYDPESL